MVENSGAEFSQVETINDENALLPNHNSADDKISESVTDLSSPLDTMYNFASDYLLTG